MREQARLLTCESCALVRAIRPDGVAELLLTAPEWTQPAGLLERLAADPAVYDWVQRLAGSRRIQTMLRARLAFAHGTVLDVGAGTGAAEKLLPPGAEYVWLDADPKKLAGFRARSTATAILAEATRLPFPDESVDWTLSIGVSHHLDNDDFAAMLDELHRVTRRRLVFLDALLSPRRSGRLLWRLDRGHHARALDEVRAALEQRFVLHRPLEFSLLHDYFLVAARRR
jgi:SAM-dependent methyltransferase